MPDEAEGRLRERFWDLANRFWDFGNYITAFSVGQAILFAASLGTSKDLRSAVLPIKGSIAAVVIVGLVVYLVGMLICYCCERRLRTLVQEHREIARAERAALLLRTAAIVLSHALLITAVVVARVSP